MASTNDIGESSVLKDTGVESRSTRLLGRRIAVAITGGIGAVEVVKIIREFRRHGASVGAYLTPDAEKFITPLSVSWAANGNLVRTLTEMAEHLERFDCVVVVPATLNSISKAALGIGDNAVTCLVANQLASRGKILFVPAMNVSMLNHPLFEEHRSKLEGWGARFLQNEVIEARVKVPEPMQLIDVVERYLEEL